MLSLCCSASLLALSDTLSQLAKLARGKKKVKAVCLLVGSLASVPVAGAGGGAVGWRRMEEEQEGKMTGIDAKASAPFVVASNQ